ncbi:cytochrome d ubiquinol oxidase subunit II, partial [Acetobacter sp. DmW_125126]
MDLTYWLPVIWAVILVAAISIYVILDGFDLGI